MLTATKMQANEPLLPAAHATLVKFGYPRTLVHQGQHWAVLVRPAQPTLGSLVLCALADKTAYGDLPLRRLPSRPRSWAASNSCCVAL